MYPRDGTNLKRCLEPKGFAPLGFGNWLILTWPMAKRLKLFGITYLVGKISRSNLFFQGPGRLSENLAAHSNLEAFWGGRPELYGRDMGYVKIFPFSTTSSFFLTFTQEHVFWLPPKISFFAGLLTTCVLFGEKIVGATSLSPPHCGLLTSLQVV